MDILNLARNGDDFNGGKAVKTVKGIWHVMLVVAGAIFILSLLALPPALLLWILGIVGG